MNPHPSRRRFLKIAAVQAAAFAVWGTGRVDAAAWRPQRWRGVALGGEVGIDLYGAGESTAVFAQCRTEMLRLERIFSLYRDDSVLGRLNREGHVRDTPREFRDVLALARTVSEITEGAFDVTVHPLCEALATGETDGERAAAARALVDYRAVRVEGEHVSLGRPGMAITLNGIAQGYITDRVTEVLATAGYTAALVDMGEKRALGGHPDNRPWRIGVRSPWAERGELAGVIELGPNRALATSGGYGQTWGGNGRHHLLDARSGESRTGWASVSVLAPTAMEADALSTALAVSAPEKAGRLLSSFYGAEARVLTAEGGWVAVAPTG